MENSEVSLKGENKEIAEISNVEFVDGKIKVKGDDLTPISMASYSVGHFQNDICASCWFNFLSYYLVHIKELSTVNSGWIMLAGQIADAIGTTLVGLLSDKFDTRFGKRTPWYVVGTIVATICFTLIFQSDLFFDKNSSESSVITYFVINCSVFNIGWASVQIAHMALLPSLSLSKKRQDKLTRLRTGFTFAAQLISLLLSLVFFAAIDDKNLQFSIMTLCCIALGLMCSGFFLISCNEKTLSQNIKLYYETIRTSINKRNELLGNADKTDETEEDELERKEAELNELNREKNIDWKYWMSMGDYYLYMLVYMFIRMAINVSNTMIPFYCKNILDWKKEDGSTPVEISIFLIILNSSSVLNSAFLENYILSFVNKKNHRIIVFIISLFVVSIGCIPLYFLGPNSAWVSYIMAFPIGMGFSMGLSGASSLINDLVGSNGSKGAIVYGTYSFMDKISCGVLIFFMIQFAENNLTILKIFISYFPTISIFAALICIIIKRSNSKIIDEIGNKRDKKQYGTITDNSFITYV